MDTKICYSAPYCDGRTPLQFRNMSGPPPSMTILVTGGAGHIGGQGPPFRRIGDYSRPRTDRIVPLAATMALAAIIIPRQSRQKFLNRCGLS